MRAIMCARLYWQGLVPCSFAIVNSMSSSNLSAFEYTTNDNTCQNHLSPELCNFKYFNYVFAAHSTLCSLNFAGWNPFAERQPIVNAKDTWAIYRDHCVWNSNAFCGWLFLFRKFHLPFHTLVTPTSTFNLCFISIWCQELWHKIRPMRQ